MGSAQALRNAIGAKGAQALRNAIGGKAIAGLPRAQMAQDTDDRLAAMFEAHFALVWRSLRRLGVHPDAVDDAAQEVFVVASRRLAAIENGKEKAFLLGTALRVAADARRASA